MSRADHLIFALIFAIPSCFALSCSKSASDTSKNGEEWLPVEEPIKPNTMEAYVPLKGEITPLSKEILGCGYDVMGDMYGNRSVRKPVVDIAAMERGRVVRARLYSGFSNDIYSKNGSEFVRNIPYSILDYQLNKQEELKGKIYNPRPL